MESILQSVKKLLGITPEYTAFDIDITMHINSVFMILTQLGVGPSEGFSIIDDTAVWTDFLPETDKNSEPVKSYMNLKVKTLFDPPASSIVMEAMNRMINEFEWRMTTQAELDRKEVNQNGK